MKTDILATIGTPLVELRSPPGTTVATKLESFNPGGSAKDRPARSMVVAAERAGEVVPGDRLVEPTSGNTGIGLAFVCAAKGYDLTIVMPTSKSAERRRIMRAYGATIELVEGDMADARDRADVIQAETGAVQLGQFVNAANPAAHYRTTGPEILDAVGDRRVDAFVATVGTGGTLTGTTRRLREAFPALEAVAVEPAANAVLSGEESGEDQYQGMGPGFVSEILDVSLIDAIETVPFDAAVTECQRLARDEGILVGQSSGAASLAAARTAERLVGAVDDGDEPLVVTVFPDSGERYLSTGLFEE